MLVTPCDVAIVHCNDAQLWFHRVAQNAAVVCGRSFSCDNSPTSVLSRAVCAHYLASQSDTVSSCDLRLRTSAPYGAPSCLDVVRCVVQVVVPGSGAVVCPIVGSAMRLLPGPCECMFTAPHTTSAGAHVAHYVFAVERIPSTEAIVRHWERLFDMEQGSASAAAYESALDVLLHMLSGPRSVSAAARCCSVAKGLVHLAHVLDTCGDVSQPVCSDAIFLAAAALDVGVGALDALRASLATTEDRAAFMDWAVRAWIAYLEGAVNASLNDTWIPCRGRAKRLLVSWDGAAGVLSWPLQATGANACDAAREGSCLPAEATAVFERALRGTRGRDAWYNALQSRTPDSWTQLLEVHRAGMFELPAHRTVVVRWDGETSLPATQHRWGPVHDSMLPCAFVRLVEAALPLLVHCRFVDDGVAAADTDADEGCSVPSLLLHGASSTASMPTIFSSYRLLKTSSKIRLLLMTLRLRFAEYDDDDMEHVDAATTQHAGVLLHQRSCLLRFVGCSSVVPWVHQIADVARDRFHAPLVQAALRARRSVVCFSAPRRMKQLAHHTTMLQCFLRSHASMRATCRREFFAAVAVADVGARPASMSRETLWSRPTDSTGLSEYAAHHEPRRRVATGPSRQCRALLEATQNMEARFRALVVEDEHAVRTCAIITTVARWFPLWKVAQDEASVRAAMSELEETQFRPMVHHEEDALRQRVQFLEARAWRNVLGRTIETRQRVVYRQEETDRMIIQRAFDEVHREWTENVALMNHLESLAELRSGAALRQAVQRERSRVELPFRRSDPFTRDPTCGGAETPVASLASALPVDAAANNAAFSRQRERFLTNVLEEIAVLLAEERQTRFMLVKKIVVDELRGRESAERVTISKQCAFHGMKLLVLEQRMRMWAVERRQRSILYGAWRCGCEELLQRRRIALSEHSLRDVLLQVANLERHHRQEAADEWTAVRSDRYASPAVLLAELQREQRDVQRLLTSMAASDAVQRRNMQARLRGDAVQHHSAARSKSPQVRRR